MFPPPPSLSARHATSRTQIQLVASNCWESQSYDSSCKFWALSRPETHVKEMKRLSNSLILSLKAGKDLQRSPGPVARMSQRKVFGGALLNSTVNRENRPASDWNSADLCCIDSGWGSTRTGARTGSVPVFVRVGSPAPGSRATTEIASAAQFSDSTLPSCHLSQHHHQSIQVNG